MFHTTVLAKSMFVLCIDYFNHCSDKIPSKREEGLTVAPHVRVPFITVERAWWEYGSQCVRKQGPRKLRFSSLSVSYLAWKSTHKKVLPTLRWLAPI